ncbi:hypothetical protein RJ641_034985, partial [Dillenia turbinata]
MPQRLASTDVTRTKIEAFSSLCLKKYWPPQLMKAMQYARWVGWLMGEPEFVMIRIYSRTNYIENVLSSAIAEKQYCPRVCWGVEVLHWLMSSGRRFPVAELDFGFKETGSWDSPVQPLKRIGVSYMNQRPSAKGDRSSRTISAILWPEMAASTLESDSIFQPHVYLKSSSTLEQLQRALWLLFITDRNKLCTNKTREIYGW